MKAKIKRQNGFVMFIVIACMALVGGMVFVVTHAANNLRAESKMVYRAAVARNLELSGHAWVRQNTAATQGISGEGRSLDVGELAPGDVKLDVSMTVCRNGEDELVIESRCRR